MKVSENAFAGEEANRVPALAQVNVLIFQDAGQDEAEAQFGGLVGQALAANCTSGNRGELVR
jgi:hypothetical protein